MSHIKFVIKCTHQKKILTPRKMPERRLCNYINKVKCHLKEIFFRKQIYDVERRATETKFISKNQKYTNYSKYLSIRNYKCDTKLSNENWRI